MSAAESARVSKDSVPKDPQPGNVKSTWPQGVSHTPTMSIGAALAVLTKEFPAVRISKIRFLEEQGIVTPHRTPSGYRSYSQADIERLRFALAAQRDSFLPLKVIRERLQELDEQGAGAPSVGARVVTEDGELTEEATHADLTREQLAKRCSISELEVDRLVQAGLVQPDFSGRFSAATAQIVSIVQELVEAGVDLRHLKAVRQSVERQVELIRQVTAPMRSKKSSSSAAAAATQSRELANTLGNLYTSMLSDGVDRL